MHSAAFNFQIAIALLALSFSVSAAPNPLVGGRFSVDSLSQNLTLGSTRHLCEQKNPCLIQISASYVNWDFFTFDATKIHNFTAEVTNGALLSIRQSPG